MKHSGFSLIELLMVIGIISILSTIAIPSYDKYVSRARVHKLLVVGESYKVRALDVLSEDSSTFKATYLNPLDIVNSIVLDLINDEYIINVHANLSNLKIRAKSKNLIIKFVGKPNATNDFLLWTCNIQQEYAEYAKHCIPGELS